MFTTGEVAKIVERRLCEQVHICCYHASIFLDKLIRIDLNNVLLTSN
jgi:hypothetical protein